MALGSNIAFAEAGRGAPLVLIHGFPVDARMWAGQLSGLSDRYRVITPDLRGFGGSTSSDPFTMESQADGIHDLLAKLGALPCILGGLSMGGYIALAFARKNATDLRGLILFDTKAAADDEKGARAARR